jgi:hypothetical protein
MFKRLILGVLFVALVSVSVRATVLDPVTNFAKGTVNTTYDSTATSVVLQSGDGANFPSTFSYNVIWWNATDYPDPSDDPNKEIVRVSNRSSDTLTVARAQEGTTASAKNTSGKTYLIVLGITKKVIDDIDAGFTGTVSTQTLDYGGAVSLEIPNGAAPTVNAAGEIAVDTTITSHNGMIKYYDGTTEMVIPAIPTADLTTNDNHIIQYDLGGTKFTMEANAGSGASAALDNLAAVAVNTAIISDTDFTDDFGTGDIRWKDIYATGIKSGLTANDTTTMASRDVDGASWVEWIIATSANTPTCTIAGDVTGVTQSAADNSTKLATTAYADAAAGGGGANTALSNLAAVQINLSLTSDTDITDDLGTGDIRWKDLYSETANSGLTAADTFKIRGRDVDGAAWVDYVTVTSANTPTCVISDPSIDTYSETITVIASASGATNLDLSTANNFWVTMTGDPTFTVTNPPAAGNLASAVVHLIQGGIAGTSTASWANFKWAGSTAPTIATGIGTETAITFYGTDTTNWYGFEAGSDMR